MEDELLFLRQRERERDKVRERLTKKVYVR